jgi:large subunit ribosomal protein L3
MIKGMVGRKLGMTQIFDESGVVHPVTVIECGPNVVTQIRTQEKDGYEAIQLGFGIDKRLNKPEQGHRKASGFMSETLREVRADDVSEFEVGQQIKVDSFAPGELIDVTGTSKGRGFQGGVKRHGFSGGPKTHGQSDRERAPGSIGAGTDPGRVIKGTKMAGHMGTGQATAKNLKVVRSDSAKGILMVRGAVPGNEGILVKVRRSKHGSVVKRGGKQAT